MLITRRGECILHSSSHEFLFVLGGREWGLSSLLEDARSQLIRLCIYNCLCLLPSDSKVERSLMAFFFFSGRDRAINLGLIVSCPPVLLVRCRGGRTESWLSSAGGVVRNLFNSFLHQYDRGII